MALFSIDILGLTAGTPKASDEYVAVDVTDPTMSTIGTDKKYSLADIYSFILHGLGFIVLPPCDAASTGNYNAVYNNGIGGINATLTDASGTFAPFTIDGIPGVVSSLTTPHAYLIKNQANPAQNGIYFLTINGDGISIPWVLIRVPYFNSPSNIINGEVTVITGGLTQADSTWQLNAPGVIVVGTTALNWVAFALLSSFITLPLSVQFGGTGDTSFTPFALITGGTTSTAPLQNVAGVGTLNQVLVSQGPGALPIWASVPGVVPAALTKVDDTNVTVTLGGTPSTALLQAVSMTLGWTGQLGETRGGTGQGTYILGDTLYASGVNTLAKLAGNITSVKQYLSQTGTGAVSAAPAWATISGGDITGAALTKTDDTNVTLTLGGTPTTALLRATSLTLGWAGQLGVPRGGTGNSTFTAFSVICAGTTATGAFQNVVGLGSVGQVLTSQGAGALPQWATASGGTVTSIATNNGVTGGTITTTGTIGLAAITNNTVLANISGGSLFPSSTTLTALIDSAIGSTQGDILYRNATTWVVLPPGSVGQVLASGGPAANPAWENASGTGTVNSGLINQVAYYAAAGTAISGLATANDGLLVTSNTGVPSILAGPGTTGNVLQSNAAAAPSFSTATYPSTTTINQILYSSAANVVSGLASSASGVLVTSAGSVPSISTTLPSGLTIPGYAKSGANSDITSMTGLTGTLQAPTGVTSSTGAGMLLFTYTASAVNYISFVNNITGTSPSISAVGSDTNIILQLGGKGTGGATVQGTSTNDNATAGFVGEYVESVIASASAVTFTNGVVRDLTSISLTAGDWDIWGNITFPTVGGTAPSQLAAWISSTSATLIDQSLTGQIALTVAGGVLAGGNCINAPIRRFSLSTTTTIYISGVSVATSGNATGCGRICARRRR